jgi:hypothetical protein
MRFVTVKVAGYTFRIHANGKVVSKSAHAKRWRRMEALRVVGRKPGTVAKKTRHLKAV